MNSATSTGVSALTVRDRKHLMRAIANADHALAREVPVRRSLSIEDSRIYIARGAHRLAELDRLIAENDSLYPHQYLGKGVHQDERLRILCTEGTKACVEFEGGGRALVSLERIERFDVRDVSFGRRGSSAKSSI